MLFKRQKTAPKKQQARTGGKDFMAAADLVKIMTITDTHTQLKLYGLYKQALFGDCTGMAPLAPTERAKFNAWMSYKSETQAAAEEQYIALVKSLNPDEGTDPGMGNTVSTMGALEGRGDYETPLDDTEEELNALHDKIIEGADSIDLGSFKIDTQNREGFTFLHTAVDRGNLAVTKQLIETLGANPNLTDNDKMTALHMAVATEDEDMISYLLGVKDIDLSVQDENGDTAFDCASKDIKKLFLNNKQDIETEDK